MTDLSRYHRQMLLPQVGMEGQQRLQDSRIVLVGCGGLGSPCALYLVAAGVGELIVYDDDRVDLGNLHRQILFRQSQLGEPKARLAAKTLGDLNRDVAVEARPRRLTEEEADQVIPEVDLVVAAVDNFPTRFMLNRVCVRHKKPMIDAGVMGWNGSLLCIFPGESACYQCLYHPEQNLKSPDKAIIGPTAGVMGVLQAQEALKILLGVHSRTGKILMYSALETEFAEIQVMRNPDCPVCGQMQGECR